MGIDTQRIAKTIRWRPHRITDVRHALRLTLTVLALLATLLFVAATTPHAIAYPVEDVGFSVDGFWQPEFNGERSYRWTRGAVRVRIPGFEGTSLLLVSVQLSAPQRSDATNVPATVTTYKSAPIRFDIAPEWRTYYVLIDARSPDWRIPALTITTPVWRPPNREDERELGIVFSHMSAQRLVPSHNAAFVERWMFLVSLVALTAFATRGARQWRVLPGVLTMLLAIGAIWAPVRLNQVLPTNWQIVMGLAIITLCIEGFRRYRYQVPDNAFPMIGIVGVALGTGTVWAGWVTVGAAIMISSSILAVYSRISRSSPGGSDAPAQPSSRRTWLIGLAVVILVAGILIPKNNNDGDPFHGDENGWATAGLFAFRLAFIERDIYHPFWTDNARFIAPSPLLWSHGPRFVLPHPHIGKYLFGAGLYLAGHTDLMVPAYDFTRSPAWNKAHNRIISHDVAGAARFLVTLAAIASVALIYWLGVRLGGVAVGALAAVLMITPSSMRYHAVIIMLDVPALTLGLLALALCVEMLRSWQQGNRRAIALTIACGGACGLAVGTKLNAALIVLTCLLITALFTVWRSRRFKATPFVPKRAVIAIALCAWTVFFLSNPTLYRQPVEGIRHMLDFGASIACDLAASWCHLTPTPADRIAAILFSLRDGERLASGEETIGGLPGSHVFITIGAAALAFRLSRWSGNHNAEIVLIGAWMIITLIGLTLWLPLDMFRYVMPLVPISMLLQSYGIVMLLRSMMRTN